MPKFTTIDHLDLTVTDAKKSAQWYIQTLGLKELARFHFDDRTLIILSHPSGLHINMNQHHEQTAEAFDEHRPGLDHVGFNVTSRDDLDR